MILFITLFVCLIFLTLLAVALAKGWYRKIFEPIGYGVAYISALTAVVITFGIFFSVMYETLIFFDRVSPFEFFFSLHWSPQTSLRADQVASEGSFGMLPVLWGTFFIAIIALLLAAPIGLFTAVYLSEYANRHLRMVVKPFLEVLAGIPTVVYGFIAALLVGPSIRKLANSVGLEASSESALAAGLIIGVMIIPMICSLSDEALRAVPQSLREGALGLGSTYNEMIRKVLIPAALPGIGSGMLLAVSRAIGETMIVVMAAGLVANLTLNPLDTTTTASVQIVTLLIGDQEFDSAKTLSAFALGATLFLSTLVLNVIALRVVHRFREKYE